MRGCAVSHARRGKSQVAYFGSALPNFPLWNLKCALSMREYRANGHKNQNHVIAYCNQMTFVRVCESLTSSVKCDESN